MTVTLETRHDITLETALRVGWKGEGVRIGKKAMKTMAASRAAFMRLIEEPGIVIYGVTSGYGQHAYKRFAPEERRQHAARPSYAAMAHDGVPFPDRVVRLMALARLANFLDGHAAVRPVVAEAVAAMLSSGPMPPVPRDGAMCAGEILPLSWLFGQTRLDIVPEEKEQLALINGAPVAAALAADGAIAAERRIAWAEAVFALAAEAYKAPTGHFSPEVARLWGDRHEIAAAEALAKLWKGGTKDRRPYQAPVTFRILPKMLGRLRRDAAALADAASTSLSQVSDNPVYLMPDDEHPNGRALSTGGYHNAAAWPTLNAVAMAYADLCLLAGRVIDRTLDGKTSGLPDGLLVRPEDDRYIGTLGFGVAGYTEQARRAAQAVLLPGMEQGGFVQNDVAVPTSLAWDGQEEAGRMLDKCLGAVALVASQALHVTQRQAPPALKATLARIRKTAPPLEKAAAPGPLAEAIAKLIAGDVYDAE